MQISRDEFLEIYAGLRVCDYVDLFYTEPASDLDLVTNYLPSKLWRLNNLYTIVDKYGKRVTFQMNRSQHLVYAASLRHPRVIILKSRQQGISTLWLVSFFDDALTNDDFSIGLMAQGSDESEKLLERVKLLWNSMNPYYLSYWNLALTKDNTKEFSLTNGSSIYIRTSFRSTTLQRLHISEMGKIANKSPEKAKETKTGTLQALAQGNTGVVESTAEGDNMFKDMWDNAVQFSGNMTPKDFSPVFLSWLDDPDCNVEQDQFIPEKVEEYFLRVEKEVGRKLTRTQKNFWVTQYRELGDKVYQEYPSTATEAFMATKQGTYYAETYLVWVKKLGRERTGLYDPNLPVQVAIDLGMNDTNVLGVFQEYINNEVRIISGFEDNGQRIKYYTDWMKRQPWIANLTHVILPHDAMVKDLTSGKTRLEVFEEELASYKDEYGVEHPLSVTFTVLPKTERREGINAVREMIPNLYVDPEKCPYIIQCLYNYHKEWDEKRERFRDEPCHDEWSNGADMLRYMAHGRQGYREPTMEERSGANGRRRRGYGHEV